MKSWLSLRIFGCKSHLYTQGLCVSFLTDLWPCICFPLSFVVCVFFLDALFVPPMGLLILKRREFFTLMLSSAYCGFLSIRTETSELFSLLFSPTEVLRWFSSRRERVESWLSLRIFGCKSHFYTQELCVSFLTDLWVVHMFSSVFWGLVQVALTHRPLESFSML